MLQSKEMEAMEDLSILLVQNRDAERLSREKVILSQETLP